MADIPMPNEIGQWIRQRNWGTHHLEWHVTRLWDARTDMRQFAQSRGWSRASIQEGAAGNGLAFLAMHRVMVRQLVTAFPQHSGLFRGWQTPPTDPADINDPVPPGSAAGGPFRPNFVTAVGKIEGAPQDFAADDDFGLYVETNRRPAPASPGAVSADMGTGIHNYIHQRFSDSPPGPIDMGDPQVNLLNQRFWRLHGWIDAQWSQFRQAKGFSENDPAYQMALHEAEHHMGIHMVPMMAGAPMTAGETAPLIPLPPSVRDGLFSWSGKEAAAEAVAAPTWEGDAGQMNGVKHLFRPVDISHMKQVGPIVGTIYLLDDYDDVKGNAIKIYGMVKNKRMPPPPGAPWTEDMLLRFKSWMDAGFPKG